MARIEYFTGSTLSSAAEALVQFDVSSLESVVSAARARAPETWLADPENYERNGRVLRDSPSPRLIAYSSQDQTLYATDGCNSCARTLAVALDRLSEGEMQDFAAGNEIPADLLKRLAELVRTKG